MLQKLNSSIGTLKLIEHQLDYLINWLFRGPLFKLFDHFCFREMLPVYDTGSGTWHSLIRYLIFTRAGPRLISEIVPHYSQCFLILFMSIERYVLVRYAADAETILSKKRRLAFYTFIIIFLAALSIFAITSSWRHFALGGSWNFDVGGIQDHLPFFFHFWTVNSCLFQSSI